MEKRYIRHASLVPRPAKLTGKYVRIFAYAINIIILKRLNWIFRALAKKKQLTKKKKYAIILRTNPIDNFFPNRHLNSFVNTLNPSEILLDRKILFREKCIKESNIERIFFETSNTGETPTRTTTKMRMTLFEILFPRTKNPTIANESKI